MGVGDGFWVVGGVWGEVDVGDLVCCEVWLGDWGWSGR